MTGLAARRVWAILRREYLQRVKNKWFVVTTLGFPILFLGIGFLSGYLATGVDGGETLDLGIVDRAGVDETRIARLLVQADSSIRAEPAPDVGPGGPTGLADRVRTSPLDAFLVLEQGILEGESATLLARTNVSQRHQRTIREVVRESAVRASLRSAGLDGDEAAAVYRSSRVGLEVSRVDEQATQSQEILVALALLLTFTLYMLFIIYGQIITRGVLEEKTSDIAEILVSTVRPWELMLGKVLGIGAMGLTQIAIWIVTVVLVGTSGLLSLQPGVASVAAQLGGLTGPLMELGATFVLFFVTGYFLYAAVFAAVGAIVGDQDEVQQVSFLPMLLIVIPFLLAFTAAEAGTVGATWMTAASYFPFFTPILMVTRVTMGVAAAWEVAASVALMLVTTAGMAWVAGRIYRVGILMKGKRPTLPELLRWIRYG